MRKKEMIKRWIYGIVGSLVLCVGTVSAQRTLSLEECREMALENNAKMKNARLDVEGAREGKKEAFTKYFPNVSAVGTAFKANHGMMDMSVIPGLLELSMMDDGLLGGVTAIQPVFAGGQIVNGNKLADLALEVSRYQMRQSEDEVALTVERYYWQWISLHEKLRTIEIVESLVGSLYKDVEVAVGAGVTTRNDLLQVQLKKNGVASDRLRVENGLRLSKMVLAQYIGIGEDDFEIDFTLPAEVPSPELYRVSHEEALPTTLSYKLLEKNVEAARLQQKLKVGQYLPTVGIGAGYMYHNLLDKDRPFGMVFATVAIPIGVWWGGSHAIRKQKLQVKAAEYSRQNANELLLVQMRKLWNELEESYKQVKLSEESIAAAEENVRLNTDYYKAGTVTLSDLLDAQSLLQQSRDQYTGDYTAYLIKRTEYLQATGR